MRAVPSLAALALAAAALAPLAGAGAARPRVALTVSPARVAVVGPSSRAVVVRNAGSRTVVVDATRAALGRRTAKGWISLVPAHLTLRPGRQELLTVRVTPPRGAAPGDHHALVLLTTHRPHGARVAVRVRLGLVVRARIPGRLVRRLEPRRLRVVRTKRGRLLALSLENRGNVTERLSRGRVTILLVRGRRVVGRLRPAGRDVFPGSRATISARVGGRARGRVTATVRVLQGHGTSTVRRRYRLRL